MPNHGRAVITGVGALAANGIGKQAFWKALLASHSGIGPVSQFDATGLPCRIAGEIRDFDPDLYVNRRLKAKRLGRFSQFAIAATSMALRDAGLETNGLRNGNPIPVILGVSTSAMDLIYHKKRVFYMAPNSIPHAAVCAISTELGFPSSVCTVSNACTSSLDAMAMAAAMICRGQADLVIAGGSESSISQVVFDLLGQCGMLGSRNDAPEKACRPFDRQRDGGIIAEGAGMVVIENLQNARARGATLYAEIVGHAVSVDPNGDEDATGLEITMREGLANAGRGPDAVDTILAHGPSDRNLDRVETEMIKRVFGERAYRIPVVSIKGATGNPFGTAGVLQVAAACLSLQANLVPPTTNYEFPDPECDLDYVPAEPRTASLETVLINGHGLGRVNSSLVLQKVA
jgi:3-oxoacyl-[acyl-carrier-protein] synthase II